ncbi:hypothetical protein [Butyrivibrio proteoclasticus]|uniref:hypothetical protein n=1 Tax=Butyrivibrio proteoclasticus TaxID=43305 RepID=UPI000AC0F93D|nr:hypothetical protein [Butyrivibrio proteoclasticus]
MHDVDEFRISIPSGIGLIEYLQNYSFHDEEHNAQRIYLVRDIVTNELVAYFGLKAGLVTKNEHIIIDGGKEKTVFDAMSGIELAEFAINDSYIEKYPYHKGCGLIIFNDFIIPIVKGIQDVIGCEILYGFSVDKDGKLLNRYLTKYHFQRLDPEDEKKLHARLKPRFDNDCIFIYMRI